MNPLSAQPDQHRRTRGERRYRWLIALACVVVAGLVLFSRGSGLSALEPLPDSHVFDIPAQPVGDAIVAFSDQAGIQLVVDPGIMGTEPSVAVRGRMPADQALIRLLGCSPYRGRFLNAHTITVERSRWSCQPRPAR